MNTLLETRSGLDRPVDAQVQKLTAPAPVRLHVANHPASNGRHLSRSTAADRLALRLGFALVVWGRRHDGLRSDRAADRRSAVDRYLALQARDERELAAHRLLLLAVPRR